MTDRRPRARATEALTDAEAAALYARSVVAGGWIPLNRLWPELSSTTLRRAARGECVTPLVLSALRHRLRPGPARTQPPADTARKASG